MTVFSVKFESVFQCQTGISPDNDGSDILKFTKGYRERIIRRYGVDKECFCYCCCYSKLFYMT